MVVPPTWLLLACAEADSPVWTRIALDRSSLSSPHVSYATFRDGMTPPCLKVKLSLCVKRLCPSIFSPYAPFNPIGPFFSFSLRVCGGGRTSNPGNACTPHWVLNIPYKFLHTIIIYRIAGNFRGTKYSWFSNIETFRGQYFRGWSLHCR